MTTKEKNIYKKVLSSCIVLSMVLTGFATMFIIGGPVDTAKAQFTGDEPSLRVYGEENAEYPTHSYWGEEKEVKDFIYPEYDHPFDPGVIVKDSVTFNSIYMNDNDISAGGDDGEKAMLRMFYEPGYYHGEDTKMLNHYASSDLDPVEEFHSIVFETTYMFLDHNCKFKQAWVDSNDVNKQPVMMLPCKSSDVMDLDPGMDVADYVDIIDASDQSIGTGNGDNDGMITLQYPSKHTKSLSVDDTFSFMDHELEYVGPTWDNSDALFNIKYIGNMKYAMSHTTNHVKIAPGETVYFNRNNIGQDHTDPAHRWFITVDTFGTNFVLLNVGRVLCAGETFYVDGVRYDMPAIHVSDMNFSFITLQSPTPKGSPIWMGDYNSDHFYLSDYNVDDFSHVPSQWLASLPVDHNAWLLPPFNQDNHIMIDDIGIIKMKASGTSDCRVPELGLRLADYKDKLEIKYIDETYEPRFNSSLAEILNTTYDGSYHESWAWMNVYTKPNRYTEFVFIDQELPGEPYSNQWADGIPGWYNPYMGADGNEYFYTSSFLANNSDGEPLCQLCDIGEYRACHEHNIVDTVWEITRHTNGERHIFYNDSRLVMEFDAANCEDLYVNDDGANPTVRIYGEEDYTYPTNSWAQDETEWDNFQQSCSDWSYMQGDFVYPHHALPFYPGVIPKDSITFNAAILEDSEIYAGGDDTEKVFLRMFYEPGYYHGEDSKMLNHYTSSSLDPVEEFHGLVFETTYMFMNYKMDPKAGNDATGYTECQMILPTHSDNDQRPGMEVSEIVNVEAISAGSESILCPEMSNEDMGTNHILTDGNITVETDVMFLNRGDPIKFLDHSIEYYQPTIDNEEAIFYITYDGNMYDAHNNEKTVQVGVGDENTTYYNRYNNGQDHTDPAHRWYITVDDFTTDHVMVKVGRVLCAGETFYVDGVRHDMPAIYVENCSTGQDGQDGQDYQDYEYRFKYITLQTPIPKGDPIWMGDDDSSDGYLSAHNVDDFSHVPSQWLASLPMDHTAWLLPPFKDHHTMIDDIGLEKDNTESYLDPDWEIPAKGLILGEKDPLDVRYIDETIEPRFNTSLTERLRFLNDVFDDHNFTWLNAYVKPNRYTEMLLPDQEIAGESYDPLSPAYNDWIDDNGYDYPYTTADGNEYLITSSWWAPNCEYPEPDAISKSCYQVHDIVDVETMFRYDKWAPRMVFEFDAVDSTGLFVNCDVPTCTLTADFTYNMVDCDTVSFSATASNGVPSYSYEWDFGDMTTATVQNPTHTYGSNGDYTVTLTVTDSDNPACVETVVKTITISCSGCTLTADFDYSYVDCDTVSFSATASNGVPSYSYEWDFGDMTTGTGQTTTHDYCCDGTYTVTLTVTDSDNPACVKTVTKDVSIACVPCPTYFINPQNIDVAPCGRFTVKLQIKHVVDCDGGQAKLVWDTDHITAVSVDKTISDFPVVIYTQNAGELIVGFSDNTGGHTGTETSPLTVLEITFDATCNPTTPICKTISIVDQWTGGSGTSETSLYFVSAPDETDPIRLHGEVCVTDMVPGDFTGNGQFTFDDVTYLGQYWISVQDSDPSNDKDLHGHDPDVFPCPTPGFNFNDVTYLGQYWISLQDSDPTNDLVLYPVTCP